MGWFESKKDLLDIFTNNKNGSIKEVKIKNPNRSLTSGEKELVQSVFKNKINFDQVKIYLGSYFPLNSQDVDTLVTPNGNIYIMQKLYRSDYSMETNDFKKIFIHEMGHIWQHQKKLNVLMRAGVVQACSILKDGNPNDYDIFEGQYYNGYFEPKKLVDYNLEQQAEIISDCWAIQNNDLNLMSKNNKKNISKQNIKQVISLYKSKINEALS